MKNLFLINICNFKISNIIYKKEILVNSNKLKEKINTILLTIQLKYKKAKKKNI